MLIILYTERQIRYLLSLKPGIVFCYLDATGSIIANPPNVKKQIYYYALVLPGSYRYGPLPLLEFISEVHSVPYISRPLSVFNHSIQQMTSRNLVIDKIETDFSLALIQAALKAFNNGMSLSSYLNLMYEFMQENTEKEQTFTYIHVCSSHFIKTTIKKALSLYSEKDRVHLLGALITQLIHCAD